MQMRASVRRSTAFQPAFVLCVRAKSKSEREAVPRFTGTGGISIGMPGRPLCRCLEFFLFFVFKRQSLSVACLLPACGLVCLCGWLVLVGREGFVYLDDGDMEERAAEADGQGGGGHDGRAGQEPHGHGERGHLVPARDDPWLQRHEQPCMHGGSDVTRCQLCTRHKQDSLFHRWRPGAERAERGFSDPRTETEHGHAEPGVGEDRDGLEDDRRHLEVPPVRPPSKDNIEKRNRLVSEGKIERTLNHSRRR